MAGARQKHTSWMPPDYEPADAVAIQALARGAASPDQQKRALDWIIMKGCGTYDLAYRPGGTEGERDTLIALGRQFVGQQIVKLMKLKIGLLTRRES